jgi:predicted porin
MKMSILAFAVLSGNAALACAQSPLTVYAAPDVGSVQENGCPSCVAAVDAAPGPRDAIHGSEALGKNTSVIFTMERELRDSTGRADPEWRLSGRQAYLGLVNDFGAFTVGRQYGLDYLVLSDVGDPFQGGSAGSATNLIGSGGRRVDHSLQFRTARVRGVTAGASYGGDRIDGSPANRAWGMTLGLETGPLTLRVAHQNRHVAQVHLYDLAGNNMEARNSIVAANMKLKWGTAYAAYSVNRGWGSSPLFNPDNPYGAGLASTPSTDSRDVLVGVAVPCGRYTTLLASFIHKNDRDLANRDANQLAFGATYMLSRRTDFYAAWSHIQNINGAGYTVGNLGARGGGSSALNIGMRHAF